MTHTHRLKNKSCVNLAPLNISVHFIAYGDKRVPREFSTFHLREVRDVLSACVRRAKAVFRFEMTIPDPDPAPKDSTAAQSRESRRLEGELTAGAAGGESRDVQGMVFYYPFREGKETRPVRITGPQQRQQGQRARLSASGGTGKPAARNRRPGGGGGRSGRGRGAGLPTASACSEADGEADDDDGEGGAEDDDDDFEDDDEEDRGGGRRGQLIDPEHVEALRGVDMFWTNRLVPQSSAEKLSFYPDVCRTRLKCEQEGIAENWRGRIKCLLFFDADFSGIANNKLRLLHVNELWLCGEKNITYHPTAMNSEFKKWLKECHKELDRDVIFDNRATNLETARGCNAMFRRMQMGGKTSTVIETDSIVRLKVARGRQKEEVFGKVVCFEADVPLPADDRRYYGNASIHYARQPSEVYGTKVERAPLSSLDFAKVSKEELAAIAKRAPKSMWVALFESADCRKADLVMKHSAIAVARGKEYAKLAIRLTNEMKDFLVSRPATTDRYWIRATMLTESEGVHLIRLDPFCTQDLWWFNDQKVARDGSQGADERYAGALTADSLKKVFFPIWAVKVR